MNRRHFLKFASLSLLLAQASSAKARSGSMSLSGALGSTMDVRMNLSVNGENVSGSFYYLATGNTYRVQGKVDASGDCELVEFWQGSTSGFWSGQLSSQSFRGTWRSPDGSRQYSFALS